MKKRIFSILLALCMVATLLPATALAASAQSVTGKETAKDDVSSGAIAIAQANCDEHIDENDDHLCDTCGTTMTAHTGGVANCTEKAVCEICGEEYGELDPDDHTDLTHVEAVAATTEAEGNCEYWYCGDCERYFTDEACTDEITLADTVISKLPKADDEAQPPEIIDNDPSPKTGDTAMAIAFATLLLSGSALAGLGVFGKKKQYF